MGAAREKQQRVSFSVLYCARCFLGHGCTLVWILELTKSLKRWRKILVAGFQTSTVKLIYKLSVN
ncbi:Hypothetical predicted protein [Prunus dulcis]|uniref:Uncharacterized protein n=1 Tax=Prunus dulcis TaxID=3755 RepID=A0A5E4ERH8_PRUDU|nr:Hypothetical predicted protein [Prunus dulcis]